MFQCIIFINILRALHTVDPDIKLLLLSQSVVGALQNYKQRFDYRAFDV